MNIYFFYKNESSDSWYDATIEAWEENDNCIKDGKAVSSFSLLEKLHIHACKEPSRYHCARFDHELGTNLSTGHHANSPLEFVKEQTERDYTRMAHIRYRDYQRLKSAMIKLFSNYPTINFTERLFTDAPLCRILF